MTLRGIALLLTMGLLVGCEKDSGTNAEPEFALNAPSDLRLSRIGRTAVRLEWKDTSEGEFSYLIERRTNQGPFQARLFATMNATTVVDSVGLQVESTYVYRVQATRYDQRGPFSDTVSIRLSLPFP